MKTAHSMQPLGNSWTPERPVLPVVRAADGGPPPQHILMIRLSAADTTSALDSATDLMIDEHQASAGEPHTNATSVLLESTRPM